MMSIRYRRRPLDRVALPCGARGWEQRYLHELTGMIRASRHLRSPSRPLQEAADRLVFIVYGASIEMGRRREVLRGR